MHFQLQVGKLPVKEVEMLNGIIVRCFPKFMGIPLNLCFIQSYVER